MRREVVGKAGALLEVRRSIGALKEPDERKRVGAAFGEAQKEFVEALRVREQELLDSESALTAPLDVTLPAPAVNAGGLHPTVQLMYDLNDAFTALNFEVYEGPEISSELFEFDYMNFLPITLRGKVWTRTGWTGRAINLAKIGSVCARILPAPVSDTCRSTRRLRNC